MAPRAIQRLVVVSDAHLGGVPQSVEDALLAWLDRVPSLGDGLLINGDLFGFWFGYRRAIPRAGIRTVARLAELARRLPILMTGGNHDRWGDPFWEPELGITYARNELRVSLGGGTALALHGDQGPAPTRTTRLRNGFFQSRFASFGYRLLPAELGFRVTARLARATPADSPRTRRREEATARLQHPWALELLRGSPEISLVILGHSHRPVALELLPGRRYLNPGAWFDGFRYAVVTESAMELSQFQG